MSLEIEYERPYQGNEPESLQNVNIIYVYRQIESRYPQNLLEKISHEHAKMLTPYAAECQYELQFRCKNQACGVVTIYYPIQRKNYEKTKKKLKKRWRQ